jgi:hypothetical protein
MIPDEYNTYPVYSVTVYQLDDGRWQVQEMSQGVCCWIKLSKYATQAQAERAAKRIRAKRAEGQTLPATDVYTVKLPL